MSQPKTVIVVGGGIYGITAALTLRERGHTVSLFDPGPLPRPEATSYDISKMIRMEYGSDDFFMAFAEASLAGWDAWQQRWAGVYREDGLVMMTSGPMQPGSYEYESFTRLSARGYPLERLNSKALRERYPAWHSDNYSDGFYNPRAGWTPSAKLLLRLTSAALTAGVHVHDNEAFVKLSQTDDRITGIVTRLGEAHHADVVVMAAGAWTPTLLPHLRAHMWTIGQPVFYVQVPKMANYRPPRFLPWAADVANTGWYGFPVQPDGRLKIANHGPGLAIDDPTKPPAVSQAQIGELRAFLARTFPKLADAPLLGTRMCLYCDTWDSNFYITADPTHPGLVLCTGGSGHGMKFAPLLGDLTADVVEERDNPWQQRFGWREPQGRTAEEARFIQRTH